MGERKEESGASPCALCLLCVGVDRHKFTLESELRAVALPKGLLAAGGRRHSVCP